MLLVQVAVMNIELVLKSLTIYFAYFEESLFVQHDYILV